MRSASSPEHLARYYRCYQCASPTSAFVPANPEDAPQGCTLQPVVLGEPPMSLKGDAEAGGQSHAD